MQHRTSILWLLALCLLAIYCRAVPAQDFNWKKIAPGGEEYTVEMPGQPTREGRLILIEGDTILAFNVYDLVTNKVRYQLMSFNKSPQSSVPMLRSYNAFVEGFQQAVNKGIAQTNKSIIFEKNITDGAASVQQLQIKVGSHNGLLRLYDGKNHFYVVMIIGGVENEATANRFLSSFKLGKMREPKLSDRTAIDAPQPQGPPDIWSGDLPSNMAPINVGILNGNATELPHAKYPNNGTGASGVVQVRVLVDEHGKVISAEAIEGHSTLHEVATKAALKARFIQTRFMGNPVKVSGILTYRFVGRN